MESNRLVSISGCDFCQPMSVIIRWSNQRFPSCLKHHADPPVPGELVTRRLAANIIFQLFYGGLLIADHILDQVAQGENANHGVVVNNWQVTNVIC